MATLREAIDLYEADIAARTIGQRVIRVAMLRTKVWRQDVKHLESKFLALTPGIDSRDAARCRAMAETGEHLGLERVGLVVR
jgi:hypothetical protein